jgi:hypothetical protein
LIIIILLILLLWDSIGSMRLLPKYPFKRLSKKLCVTLCFLCGSV